MKLKPEKKNSGLNGIRTLDLCDTGVVLYRLSYQAIWDLVTLWVRNIPVECEWCKWNANVQISDLSYIHLTWYPLLHFPLWPGWRTCNLLDLLRSARPLFVRSGPLCAAFEAWRMFRTGLGKVLENELIPWKVLQNGKFCGCPWISPVVLETYWKLLE